MFPSPPPAPSPGQCTQFSAAFPRVDFVSLSHTLPSFLRTPADDVILATATARLVSAAAPLRSFRCRSTELGAASPPRAGDSAHLASVYVPAFTEACHAFSLAVLDNYPAAVALEQPQALAALATVAALTAACCSQAQSQSRTQSSCVAGP